MATHTLKNARPGDRLVVRAHHQGEPERDAEILEVIGPDEHALRVRWSDGHESIIYPSPDLFVEHFPAARRRRAPREG